MIDNFGIVKFDIDSDYGVPIIEDNRGHVHILDWGIISADLVHDVILNGYRTTNFPNTTTFHPINNLITGESFLKYTVPVGHLLLFDFLSAAQSNNGLALIGIFIDNVLKISIPFFQELHISCGNPIDLYEGQVLEIKVRPQSVASDIGVTIKGTLVNRN